MIKDINYFITERVNISEDEWEENIIPMTSYPVADKTAVQADIIRITEKSYICNLLDSNGDTIALDARFLFSEAIFDQLTEEEKEELI